ncbi:MAG: ATP-dependent nuclease subunit B, partial [Oscillospiraceae bacterium]|nr:ATP-dependent nuclease subunit B [Oscillospiraceae bacterium]
MLRIVTGRAGSGKTGLVVGEIARRTAAGERGMLLLVPEQYSYNAERELCELAGNGVSLAAEVVTFKGLARRVFAETGGAPGQIDEGGRLLAMVVARRTVRDKLRVYGGRESPELTLKLLSAVAELKNYCVRPEDIAVAEDERGGLADKLNDLSLIYAAYDAQLGAELGDPADLLTRLAERLAGCSYFKGRSVYVDGFTGFTPAELKILGIAAAEADALTVTLCCDTADPGGDEVFDHSRACIADLRREAGGGGVVFETAGDGSCRRFRDPGSRLACLERRLFDYAAAGPVPPPDGSVTLFTAAAGYTECEAAAAQICRLVQEEGYRFREVAVVAPRSAFAQAVSVFEKYGIPCFADRTESVLYKTPVRAVLAAVESAAGGFRCDDCVRLAKTGLAGLTEDEADRLERYARLWNVNGKAWTEKGFTMHPRGYGEAFSEEDLAALEELNDLRRTLTGPLERLAGGLRTRTVREM